MKSPVSPRFEVAIFIAALTLLFVSRSLSNSDIVMLVAGLIIAIRVGYLIKARQLLFGDIFNFTGYKKALLFYFSFTAFGVVALWLLRDTLMLPDWLVDDNILWFMPFHILLQELIYRTYLIDRLKHIFSRSSHIVIAAGLIFGLAHFILPDATPVVLLTLVSGLVWSSLYLRYPNLLFVWLSHLTLDVSLHFIF